MLLKSIQKFESTLFRLESRVLVALVLFMLALASYNVLYRNILVPWQVSMDTLAPGEVEPETKTKETVKEPTKETDAKPKASTDDNGFGGDFDEGDDDDGFGGDFDDEEKPAPDDVEKNDDDDGFGGDFDDEPSEEKKVAPDDDDGFGGDFDEEPTKTKTKQDDDGFGGDFDYEPDSDDGFGGGFDDGDADDDGFGGGFDDAPEGDTTKTKTKTVGAKKPTPPPVRFRSEENRSSLSKAIDSVKLEWIDVVLRQLVLIVGFLGAMLATQRRKHITIDALSKVLPPKYESYIALVTNTLSLGICIVLAVAGWDLVSISREFPKELAWFADEWMFQMAFPIGFGGLAFHFAIRLFEYGDAAYRGVPLRSPDELGPAVIASIGDAEQDSASDTSKEGEE